ncbi:MAG: PEP-CTERM sorting domain-containing protein [Syntrophales bacterium]
MKKSGVILLAVISIFIIMGQASATTVNFSTTEVPGLVDMQTVTNEWSSYGITLQNTYWYTDTRDPFDQQGISTTSNPGEIIFTSPTNSVTFDWVLAGSDMYVDVWNSSNVDLASFLAPGTGPQSGTFTLSGPAISYLTFHDNVGFVAISTVTYNEAVPEPTTLLLLGLGLAGVAGIRRKLKK